MKNKKLISQQAEVIGKVEFGDGCFVHPCVTINAEGGEIIFGKNNIIEERVYIHNKPIQDQNGKFIQRQMIIGDCNLFEIGTTIYSSNIGDCNQFEQKVEVGQLSEIGNNCRFGSKSKIAPRSKISDNMRVIFPFIQSTNNYFEPDAFKNHMIALSTLLIHQEEINYPQSPIIKK